MTSALLEQRIAIALAAAVTEVEAPRPVWVRGRWEMAASGRLADAELSPVGARLEVSVDAPAFEAYSFCKATFGCTIEAEFRSASARAAAQAVLPTCEATERLLARWTKVEGAAEADLAFEGFQPAAVIAEGGEAPTLDAGSNAWRCTFRFSVTGVVDG